MQAFLRFVETRFPLIYSLCTTRLVVTLAWFALLFAVTAYGKYVHTVATADGLFTSFGPMVGGDFVVFRTGALVSSKAQMIANYNIETFAASLRAEYPGHGTMMFAWPYPPPMYFLVRPLRSLSFVTSYVVWELTFLALFLITIRSLWRDGRALFFAACSPAVLLAIITGQTGLLTASLIALFAANADRRAWLAGIAAAVLTVKPQFGILLPVALLARRNWRALGASAVSVVALILASALAFGFELWQAFANELLAHGQLLNGAARFPVNKLNTPYGALLVAGFSTGVASLTQSCVTLLLAALVYLVWRRVRAVELRLAVLASAAAMATPYGLYYEMAIFVPAVVMIAKHATVHGWLRYEKLSLILAWCASLLPPGPAKVPSVPVSTLVAVLAFVIVVRRVYAYWNLETQVSTSATPVVAEDRGLLPQGAT